jgi:predicted transcriptional regulator
LSGTELNHKVGGRGHDPKIELARAGLTQETVYCFEDQAIDEAEKLMRKGNLSQLPVLTREKANGRLCHAWRFRPTTRKR